MNAPDSPGVYRRYLFARDRGKDQPYISVSLLACELYCSAMNLAVNNK